MRIAAYCRVSTEKEEQLDSLTQQKLFFTEYAVKNNHDLIRLYADEGISGKQIKKREQFLRMLSDAKLGLFEMVVVKDISRFARNTVDFLNSIRQLKMLGIGVQFLSNNQTSLGDSEFVLTIFSALAQEESANLSKRVKFGKNINAQKGKVPNLVFGYDQVDKFTLTINETEAEVVRTMFRMYLDSGLGLEKIAQYMQRNAPVKSKRAGKWTQEALRRIIKNEIYTGVITNKKSEVMDFITGRRREFDENQWLKTEKPELAIISKEDYAKAQEIMASRRDMFNVNKQRHSNRYPFSTLIKCGHCGYSYRRMYVNRNYGQYKKWTCCGRHLGMCDSPILLDETELIGQVVDYFRALVKDKDGFIKNALANYTGQNAVEETADDTERLKKELERLTRIKEKAMDMYANEIITIEELKAKTVSLNQEIGALKQRLEGASQRAAENQYNEKVLETPVKKTFKTIEDIICEETLSNEMLKSVIDKIEVSKDGEVKIHIRHLDGDGAAYRADKGQADYIAV